MHYCCLVLIDADGDAEEQVERLLAPHCEDIGGDYNPNGHWDWYQIGGRWSGELDGYAPGDDPDNIEMCTLCNGTGTRTDGICSGEGNCNGCSGVGRCEKWPTNWKRHDGDVQPSVVAVAKKFVPYAIITPNGKWHSSESWNGHAWETEDAWEVTALAILNAHKGRVVIVDCHC